MITFKKTFGFYATDRELNVFVNNIFDTIIDDPEDFCYTVSLIVHR